MYDSSYRRLSKSNLSNGFSRNILFFIILVVLIILGSLFYLYNSTSNELATLREELASQNNYVNKLKNEILEINVNLEKSRTSENECKAAKNAADSKLTECTDELEKKKAALTDVEDNKSKNDGTIKDLNEKLNEYKALIEEQKVNMTAMKEVGVNQEAIVIKLNDTLNLLQKDFILKDEIIHRLKAQLNITTNEMNLTHSDEPKFGLTNASEKPGQNLSNINTVNNVSSRPENLNKQDDDQGDARNIPEPKLLTDHAPILASYNNNVLKEPNSKEMRGGLGDVIGNREPGARVKIEEAKEEQEKKDNESPLIDVAVKQDKAEEEEKDENIDQEIKQPIDFN